MKKLFIGIVLLVGVTRGWCAPSYIPVVNGSFMTGQYFFNGDQSSLGGNVELMVVPAVRFSSNLSLIPTYDTTYRGTRSSEELIGGNTFFQDTWENGFNLKLVHGLSPSWKLKERIGARMKWYRETTDERWTKGLYDWRSLSAGFEIENQVRRNLTWSFGYDFSFLSFPNYFSLEASQSDAMAREYAGAHPLDNTIHLMALRLNAPLFWRLNTEIKTFYSPRLYSDQTVVQSNGLLSSEDRKDTLEGAGIELNRLFRTPRQSKLIASLNYAFTTLDSNQNHYDAKQTFFVENYYSYNQNQVGGTLSLLFGKLATGPMRLETGYGYSIRKSPSRQIQAEDGSYLSEKFYLIESAFNVGFSYPLSKNFRLRTITTLSRSKSNNQYEDLYQYSYTNAIYLFGFTYDY